MSYTKHTWADRTGYGLNKFTNSGDATNLVLTPNPDTILTAGTPFTADWMNNIESGVKDTDIVRRGYLGDLDKYTDANVISGSTPNIDLFHGGSSAKAVGGVMYLSVGSGVAGTMPVSSGSGWLTCGLQASTTYRQQFQEVLTGLKYYRYYTYSTSTWSAWAPVTPPVISTTDSAVSIANSTYANLNSVSLDAGTYTVQGYVQWTSNATGRRLIHLTTTSNGSTVDNHTSNMVATINGASTRQSLTTILNFASSTTLYLVGWQNSGGALNGTGGIRAVKMG